MEERINLEYKSNCKINLGLTVLNRRSDNFHNLESIFAEIDLHDNITFTKSSKFEFNCSDTSLSSVSGNTIMIAYEKKRLLAYDVQEYSIYLEKNIPIGSGLGGGSSNAATTLKVLDTLWNLDLSNNELLKIAKSIGSDVPFFIDGGVQYITGIGDILNGKLYQM